MAKQPSQTQQQPASPTCATEYTSSADVAYDTAIESAVWGGFGYLRVVIDYAYDDSFDHCATCQLCLDNQCRRFPPPFPHVNPATDWCGEHKPQA